jgi:hypothetical protein
MREGAMIRKIRPIVLTMVAAVAFATTHALAQSERFEITSIKAIRPTLVNTIAALKAGDVARARESFDAYD